MATMKSRLAPLSPEEPSRHTPNIIGILYRRILRIWP